jgi:branched-subunit amino acid ABC-type transport system permease component
MRKLAFLLGAAALVATPLAANAQSDTAVGVGAGAVTGAVVGGPVGAAVGAGVGAIAGGISDANHRRFHEYVVHEHPTSYRYEGEVRVGVVLPRDRVTYYEVPREYGVTQYRYTVVNDRTVLVDPGTGRVVQVID